MVYIAALTIKRQFRMKKLILSLLAFTTLFVNAQHNEPHPCHTTEQTELLKSSLTPQELQARQQAAADLEAFTAQWIADNPDALVSNGARSITYTIPVVFHIIHAGGPENISDEQVIDCIRIMNEDYQKLNADVSGVVAAFQPIVADAQIEFKLARKDPNGVCTNGITRTFSTITFGGTGNQRISVVQNAHGNWPGNRYMNVYVAADIGGAAGYTTYPAFGGTGMGNGIHVLQNYVGSIGTSSSFTSRTMTHEAGHWLNLPHLWGNSNDPGLAGNCTGDDGVADTPNTIGWTTCNLSGESCGSLDNVQNYMEYSYCSRMFTNGQKARMHAALASTTGGRSTVVSAANLTFTGVNLPDILCKARFEASQTVVCVGQEINFQDLSFNAPSQWTWTFTGGSPASSNLQNPTVIYNTPGTYSVTLVASDGTNQDTEAKTAYITVLPASEALPFIEGFENFPSFAATNRWIVENPGNNSAFQVGTAAHTGSQAARLNNFGQPVGNFDELISAPIDLSGITDNVTLTFRYAYRKRAAANDEWLRVFISGDCGENWAQRRTIRGNTLSPTVVTTSWEPSSADDWTTIHMTNVTSLYWVQNFRVRFQFESDGGNNFFLDNINIYPGTPQENVLNLTNTDSFNNFMVYPNPTDGLLNVQFSLEQAAPVRVELMNMLGQVVESSLIQATPGSNLIMMGTEQLRSGVYTLRVNAGGTPIVQQVVVK